MDAWSVPVKGHEVEVCGRLSQNLPLLALKDSKWNGCTSVPTIRPYTAGKYRSGAGFWPDEPVGAARARAGREARTAVLTCIVTGGRTKRGCTRQTAKKGRFVWWMTEMW